MLRQFSSRFTEGDINSVLRFFFFVNFYCGFREIFLAASIAKTSAVFLVFGFGRFLAVLRFP